MAESFKQTEEPDSLMHFLANRITSPEPCVRHIVLHYLHKVFPPDHVRSRFLLAWACADKYVCVSCIIYVYGKIFLSHRVSIYNFCLVHTC